MHCVRSSFGLGTITASICARGMATLSRFLSKCSASTIKSAGTSARFSWICTAQSASNSHDLRDVALLCAIGLLSRLPFLGIGEPDSALFVIGVKQWLRGGPHSPIIYSGAVCGGYYAVIAGTIRHLHLGEETSAALMSIVSAIACLIILTTGYNLGQRFVGSQNALKAMLLFCFSPGLWWSTIQPHPEAISLAFALLGIWSFVRFLESGRAWSAFLASAMFFGIAISLKKDGVLLLPALYGFSLLCGIWWRNFVMATGVIGLAGVIALLLGRLATGPSSQDVTASAHSVEVYFGLPVAMELVKQLLPICFGFGLVTFVAIAFLIPGVLRQSPDRYHWLLILGTWCLSGYLFWMLIRGNNIRHTMAFGIPLFWLISTRLRLPHVIVGSIKLFRGKMAEVSRLSKQASQASSCVMGSYSNDYVLERLLGLGGQIAPAANSYSSDVLPREIDVIMPNGNRVKLFKVAPSNKWVQLNACSSLEYGLDGRKMRFLGTEWPLPIF
jgi:hypothetical protein